MARTIFQARHTLQHPTYGSIISLTVIAVALLLPACSDSKKYIDFAAVRQGNHLNNAREITTDAFLTAWLENTVPLKANTNLNELYSDSLFTYFGKQTFKYQKFFKVKNENLRKVNHHSINGDSIRSKFYDEIIPSEDKDKARSKQCISTTINIDFKYKFIESENIIEITCRYKVVCEFVAGLVKKEYFARYDITNRAFIKI